MVHVSGLSHCSLSIASNAPRPLRHVVETWGHCHSHPKHRRQSSSPEVTVQSYDIADKDQAFQGSTVGVKTITRLPKIIGELFFGPSR